MESAHVKKKIHKHAHTHSLMYTYTKLTIQVYSQKTKKYPCEFHGAQRGQILKLDLS